MTRETQRGIKEGLGFGLIAGVIFALMEIVAAALMGNAPLMPVRMSASVVAGDAALETMSLGSAFVLGIAVHLVLSAVFGLIYGLVNARFFSAETKTHWGPQVGLGLAFGAALWLVNFQIIARVLYPWFLDTPQFLQLVMHALFFGLPLALMYAGAERRVYHVHRPASAT